jgi:hypothetical protein
VGNFARVIGPLRYHGPDRELFSGPMTYFGRKTLRADVTSVEASAGSGFCLLQLRRKLGLCSGGQHIFSLELIFIDSKTSHVLD